MSMNPTFMETVKRTLPNGAEYTYAYDKLGRIIGQGVEVTLVNEKFVKNLQKNILC